MTARVQALPDPAGSSVELDALVMNLKDIAKRVIKLMPELPKEAGSLIDSVTEPGQLADLITSNLDVAGRREAGSPGDLRSQGRACDGCCSSSRASSRC